MIDQKNFNDIRICNNIDQRQQDSYFKMKINDQQNNVHKKSAYWLLIDKNKHLSNDQFSSYLNKSQRSVTISQSTLPTEFFLQINIENLYYAGVVQL